MYEIDKIDKDIINPLVKDGDPAPKLPAVTGISRNVSSVIV